MNTATSVRSASNAAANQHPHLAYEDAPINGPAFKDAEDQLRRLRDAHGRVTRAIAEAKEAGGLSPDAVANLILNGDVSADTPGDLPSLENFHRQARALDEAMRRQTNTVDAARKACAHEIADQLRAGEFGTLTKRITAAQAEVKAASDARTAFVKRCAREVTVALIGFVPE